MFRDLASRDFCSRGQILQRLRIIKLFYATVDEMKSTSLSAAALPLVENIYVSVRPALYIVFNADGPSGSEPVPSQDEIL